MVLKHKIYPWENPRKSSQKIQSKELERKKHRERNSQTRCHLPLAYVQDTKHITCITLLHIYMHSYPTNQITVTKSIIKKMTLFLSLLCRRVHLLLTWPWPAASCLLAVVHGFAPGRSWPSWRLQSSFTTSYWISIGNWLSPTTPLSSHLSTSPKVYPSRSTSLHSPQPTRLQNQGPPSSPPSISTSLSF